MKQNEILMMEAKKSMIFHLKKLRKTLQYIVV